MLMFCKRLQRNLSFLQDLTRMSALYHAYQHITAVAEGTDSRDVVEVIVDVEQIR